MTTTTEWETISRRTEVESRIAEASRDMVTFAVLDYDSLLKVLADETIQRTTAVIYKKITTHHEQRKEFSCIWDTDDGQYAFKDFTVPVIPIFPATPATDTYNYSGERTIEYKLAVVVGESKYEFPFNTLITSVSGSFDKSGAYSALTTDGGEEDITGPAHVISGQRIYGASVYVGKEYVIFSYDLEDFIEDYGYGAGYDSPFNFEDYNLLWTKSKRVVGYIKLSSMELVVREYDYDPDTMEHLIYAAGYYEEK